jgi:hypothetical protein
MVYGPLTAALQDGRAAGASIREVSVTLHPLSPTDALPLGDMPLAPFAMTKRTEADLAQAMVEHLREAEPGSGSEALSTLRRAFPDTPLSARVGVFASLMRRSRVIPAES